MTSLLLSAERTTGTTAAEHRETFPCFGSDCTVIVSGRAGGSDDAAVAALARAKQALLGWHHRFSRFEPASELSLLNADPRSAVPVSPLMRRVVEAALRAANTTEGLVDATLAPEIERAGYAGHLEGPGIGLERLIELAPPRAAGRPHPAAA